MVSGLRLRGPGVYCIGALIIRIGFYSSQNKEPPPPKKKKKNEKQARRIGKIIQAPTLMKRSRVCSAGIVHEVLAHGTVEEKCRVEKTSMMQRGPCIHVLFILPPFPYSTSKEESRKKHHSSCHRNTLPVTTTTRLGGGGPTMWVICVCIKCDPKPKAN